VLTVLVLQSRKQNTVNSGPIGINEGFKET